ncbi:MAG TPA: RHS repeat-associated core domain-containing protein [Actinomycetota bacterium]
MDHTSNCPINLDPGDDVFGNDAGSTKNDLNAPTNVMRFDGQVLDPATGLYYLRARIYDQSLGRFLQIDPMPQPMTEPYAAAYVYVNDRPTVLSDPSGMSIGGFFREWWRDWKAGASELYQEGGPGLDGRRSDRLALR